MASAGPGFRVLIVGPPGAGKGTQARRLSEDSGVPHIATGDLLRELMAGGSELGRRVKSFVDRGDYVSDDIMIEMIADRLGEDDARKGFILDGYPRTDAQATALDGLLAERGEKVETVLVLDVPAEEIVRRVSGRRVCPTCQRVYHVEDNPPTTDGVCDDDGTELVTRTDDEPETVRHRLGVYGELTEVLVEHYKPLGVICHVDGVGSPHEVAKRIDEALGELV
jgi:adenylate kinase